MNVKLSLKRDSGFTLIEILVVICIIALLAAILFPVFQRARENARRSSCQSNVRQISLGLYQYTGDYDSRYPMNGTDRDGVSGWNPHNATSLCIGRGDCDEGWAETVMPYVKSRQIFQCPSDKIRKPFVNDNSDNGNYTDYWLSYNLFNKQETQVRFPALTILSGDASPGEGGSDSLGSSECGASANNVPEPACNKGAAQDHLEGSNYAFVDGHAKWFRGTADQKVVGVWDDDLSETTTPKLGSVYSWRF